MRISFGNSKFCFGLLLVIITSQLTSAATIPQRIISLLNEAMSAKTMDVVEEKLDEADKWINKRRNIDEIERGFIDAHIKQTSGRIYIVWGQNLGDINIRDKGYNRLRLASDDYKRIIQKCEERSDQSRKRRKNLPSDSKRLLAIERNIILAKYKWAWTEYYLADASDQRTVRENRFNSALEKFREFTREGDPNKPLIADCLICQAQCFYELEDYSEIVELLDPKKFRPENIQSRDKEEIKDIYKRTTLLRMKAYQKTDNHQMAEDSAKRYFDKLPEITKLDATELEMTILRIRSLGVLIDSGEPLRTRLNELCDLIRPYGENWRKKLSGELDKIGIKTPYWYLNEAEKNLNARNFKEAIDYVETGLKEATVEEQLCANLRYIKCVAFLRLNNWGQAYLAAKEFLENHPNDSRAVKVCSWGVKSGLQALKSDPGIDTELFLQFLESVEKNFPENSEVHMIPWYKGYLLFQEGRYSPSQKILKTIESDSPAYHRAQHCLATAAYKQAKALMDAGENEKVEITKQLEDAIDALIRFADDSPENLTKKEFQLARNAVTLTIETSRCMLNLNPADPQKAKKVFELIESMQNIQNQVHQSEDQWLAQCIRANLLAGNINPATGLIETLLGKATTANLLIDISKPLEQISEQLTKSGRSADAESIDKKLIKVYITLFQNYISRSKDEQMRANEPSVRILMANCHLRLREYNKAIDHYEWYMDNVPKGKSPDKIRSLAIAYEQTKKYDRAIQQWRKLYGSLSSTRTNDNKMTNEWIEAGYHLIWCHIKVGNHDHGRKVLKHFELICSQSELGEWGRKFETLKKELLVPNVRTDP